MSDPNVSFSRSCYNSVVADIRAHIKDFKSSEYWTWRDGNDRCFEVQGPDGFYWYGAAHNAWEAKFEAFLILAAKLNVPDYDE